MDKKIYMINYTVINNQGIVIKTGLIKVKNKANEFEAKCGLEVFLKKKYKDFGSLQIQNCKCKHENPFGVGNPLADFFNKSF